MSPSCGVLVMYVPAAGPAPTSVKTRGASLLKIVVYDVLEPSGTTEHRNGGSVSVVAVMVTLSSREPIAPRGMHAGFLAESMNADAECATVQNPRNQQLAHSKYLLAGAQCARVGECTSKPRNARRRDYSPE
jgi:hypothetical protein